MNLLKTKGMRALAAALIAAVALVLTVIVIAFGGAGKRAESNGTDSDSAPSAPVTPEETPAALGSGDPEPTSPPETEPPELVTERETEPETTAPPVYELAFVSNGDGTCYVAGIGTYRRSEVEIPTLSPTGDIVTGIGGYAFRNASSIVRISIPSTVRTVGEYAFLGCTSLIEITVSPANTAFKAEDGVLYSRDGTRLVCCPPMRGKTTCTVGTDVSVIECGAFSDAKHLKAVYYTGTAEQWTEIRIHAHNELLETIRLVCNYKEP